MRLTRFLAPALVLLAVAPAAAPAAVQAAKGFVQGVSAGDVTDAQATLWTRAPHAGAVTVRYSTTPNLDLHPSRLHVSARGVDDLTLHVRVRRGARTVFEGASALAGLERGLGPLSAPARGPRPGPSAAA